MIVPPLKDIGRKAVWYLLWFSAMWAAMSLLEVPSGLHWYQIVGGGACLGLANLIYEKLCL